MKIIGMARRKKTTFTRTAVKTVFIGLVIASSLLVSLFIVGRTLPEQVSTTNKDETADDRPSVIKELNIVLVGERNSGTKWILSHLMDCYDNTTPREKRPKKNTTASANITSAIPPVVNITVTPRLSRFKHWFQDEHILIKHRPDLIPSSTKKTIVVSMFRDPYEWVAAMRHYPHHASSHRFMTSWHTHVTKPWNRDNNARYIEDQALERTFLEMKQNKHQIQCQEHFTYEEINSCLTFPYHENPDLPWPDRYELRRDQPGVPYDSILDLRREKIHNFLNISTWESINAFIPTLYEDLLYNGTSMLLDQIQQTITLPEGVMLPRKCSPYPPQPERVRRRNHTTGYMDYITNHLDWEVEALLGYKPLQIISSSNDRIATDT